MEKYPVITKENFEEMTKKLVYHRKYKREKLWGVKHLRVPIPETRQEFFDMTKNMFGVGLGVTGNAWNYEIDGDQSIYARLPIPALWDVKYSQYDGLKVFLEFTFGPLSCGGVAGTHYGSFHQKGYRHKRRLQKFWQSEFVPSEDVAKNS